MGGKPRLSFYTNIPTPYQLDFFDALSELFELKVVYYATIEEDRMWKLDTHSNNYEIVHLKKSLLSNLLLKVHHTLHYSGAIFRQVLTDPAPYVIVGGSYIAPNAIIAMLLSRLRGKKIAFLSEAFQPAVRLSRRWLRKIFLVPLRISCDMLFAIGDVAANSYQQQGINKPTYKIPYSIDSTQFDINNLDPAYLHRITEEIKPQGNEFVFITSGSLIHRKGIDTLVKAFSEGMPPHVKLLIMGDGPDRSDLEKLANNNPNIIFMGFAQKNAIPYYFNAADAFIFASRYDGWAVVINEAIAARLPIISSNTVGAALDLIQHNENGYLCTCEDPLCFRKYALELVNNPQKYAEIVQKMEALIPIIDTKHYAQKTLEAFTQNQ